MIEPRRLAVDFQDPCAQLCHPIVHVVLRHLQAGALRQKAHRFHIVQILDAADKGDDIPAHTAAKAIKRAVFRVHIKRRRFLMVKGTQPDHIPAAAPQADIRRHHIDNIAAHLQLLQKSFRQRHCHSSDSIPSIVTPRLRDVNILKQTDGIMICHTCEIIAGGTLTPLLFRNTLHVLRKVIRVF